MAKRFLLLLSLSVLISVLGFKVFTAFPQGLMVDDSYFYSQIAYMLGVNHISSFDGINITSGYHLLWGWTLGLTSFIMSQFTLNKDYHLMGMLTVYIFLCLFIVNLFCKTFLEKITLLFFTFFSSILMETPLLTLFLLIFIDNFREKTKYPKWLINTVLVLIPLTRVDGSLIIILISLYYLKNKNYRDFIITNCFLSVGIAIHFMLMNFIFGNWASVSSLIKAGSLISFDTHISMHLKTFTRYIVTIAILYFATFITIYFSNNNDCINKQKHYFIVSGLLSFIVIHAFANSDFRYWYYIPSFVILSHLLFSISSPIRTISIVGLIILIATWSGYKVINTSNYTLAYSYSQQFIEKVQQIVPPDEPIYQYDGSGFTGYFSNRMIINGDGLVNSYKYLDILKTAKVQEYLKDNNIKYVITYDYHGDNLLISSGITKSKKDIIQLITPPAELMYSPFTLIRLEDDFGKTKI